MEEKINTALPPPVYDADEDWVLNYIEQFGSEPSFF